MNLKRVVVHVGLLLACVMSSSPAVAQGRKAWVERHEGITVLHLSGTWYEMGHQQGTLMKSEMQESVQKMWVGPLKAALGAAMADLQKAVLQVAALCPSYITEELRGMADAAQMPYEDLLLASLAPDILQNMGVFDRFDVKLPGAPGCSNMAAFGRATRGGSVYHAVNFDWVKGIGIQKHYQVTCYRPRDGFPFITIGWTGNLYVTTGINANGLSTGMVGATNVNNENIALPMGILQRRVVQEAESLQQAVAIISGAKRPSGYNYVMAQSKPPYAAAVETDAKHAEAWYPNDARETKTAYAIPLTDAMVRSDEALSAIVRGSQTCSHGDPGKPGLEDPSGTESYDHRYKGLCEGVKKHFGTLDAAQAIELARAAAIRDTNMHSVVYDNGPRELHLAVAQGRQDAWQGRYVHLTWKLLFP